MNATDAVFTAHERLMRAREVKKDTAGSPEVAELAAKVHGAAGLEFAGAMADFSAELEAEL